MRLPLTERRDLIEQQAEAVLDTVFTEGEGWTAALGTQPQRVKAAEAWRRLAVAVAACRDRYSVTGTDPLGEPADTDAQKVDAARARAALDRAAAVARSPMPSDTRRPARSGRTGPAL